MVRVLENRARQHVRTSAAVASLGSTGTHTYHAAIWSPSFAEGLENLDLRRWSRDLRAMIDDLHRAHPIPLVLMHMPLPAGIHPAAVVARPWVRRLNQVIDTAAAQHAHVEVATTEPFHAREIGEPVTSPAYFAAVAARLAPVVLRALDLSTDEADADAATLPARR